MLGLDRWNRKGLFLLGAFLGIAFLASSAWGDNPVLNEWCPVLTDQKADPSITTTYRGQTIAFCCDRCLAKFKADPEKYLEHLPQFARSEVSQIDGKQSSASEPSSDQKHDTGLSQSPQRIPWLGRVHPVLVHFPLAGIPLAFLGLLVWMISGRESFAKADIPPLLVGTLASVAAVITGNIALDSMRFSATMAVIAEWHELVSTTIMILALGLSAFRVWRWNRLTGSWRWVYAGALFVTCVLLGVTGYLGGSLVFGPDHLAWS